MKIDAHLHLDEKFDIDCGNVINELNLQLLKANFEKGIVLHLETQPWSAEDVARNLANYERLFGFININPLDKDAEDKLNYGVKKLNFIGLKLHPRLQCYDLNNEKVSKLCKVAGDLGIPVLIDAFPDGTHLMQGFSPLKYSNLALNCSNTNFIWAHMGGHYVLDFMMLAKRLQNVFMDLSYSLLYYQSNSTLSDIIYCIKSMKANKIFYGSDYPDRPILDSYKKSLKIFRQYGLTKKEQNKILFSNANSFFKW